jgi:hypothetical protein
MLGEMIGEDKGKIIGYRVVPSRKGDNHVEVSMKAQGKILGIEFNELATYWSVMKSGGFSYGEGRGVFMLKDGETACWVGQGVGRFKQGGGMSWRGTIYLETASQKHARMNGMCALFEHESDSNDNTSSKYWEWK